MRVDEYTGRPDFNWNHFRAKSSAGKDEELQFWLVYTGNDVCFDIGHRSEYKHFLDEDSKGISISYEDAKRFHNYLTQMIIFKEGKDEDK